MTVLELIEKLNKIEDKSKVVSIAYSNIEYTYEEEDVKTLELDEFVILCNNEYLN